MSPLWPTPFESRVSIASLEFSGLRAILASSNRSAIGVKCRHPEGWCQTYSGRLCRSTAVVGTKLRGGTLGLYNPAFVRGILDSFEPDVCHFAIAIVVWMQRIKIVRGLQGVTEIDKGDMMFGSTLCNNPRYSIIITFNPWLKIRCTLGVDDLSYQDEGTCQTLESVCLYLVIRRFMRRVFEIQDADTGVSC